MDHFWSLKYNDTNLVYKRMYGLEEKEIASIRLPQPFLYEFEC
jgi:hypothetical protein